MSGLLPAWFVDASAVSSVLGLVVSVWVLRQTTQIKRSFLLRARLPEIVNDLEKIAETLPNALYRWQTDARSASEEFAKARGLLQNLAPKLSDNDLKREIKSFLDAFVERRSMGLKRSSVTLTEDRSWELYTELNRIFTLLNELRKDSRWD